MNKKTTHPLTCYVTPEIKKKIAEGAIEKDITISQHARNLLCESLGLPHIIARRGNPTGAKKPKLPK